MVLAEYSSLNIWLNINIKNLNGQIAFQIQNNAKTEKVWFRPKKGGIKVWFYFKKGSDLGLILKNLGLIRNLWTLHIYKQHVKILADMYLQTSVTLVGPLFADTYLQTTCEYPCRYVYTNILCLS